MKKELLSALLAASIVLTGCASGKKDRKSSEQTDEIETTVNDSLEQTENEEETEPEEFALRGAHDIGLGCAYPQEQLPLQPSAD